MARHHRRSQRSSANHSNRYSRPQSSTPQPRSVNPSSEGSASRVPGRAPNRPTGSSANRAGRQAIPSSESPPYARSMSTPEAFQSVTFSPVSRSNSPVPRQLSPNHLSSHPSSSHPSPSNRSSSDSPQAAHPNASAQGKMFNHGPQAVDATATPQRRSLLRRILTHWLFWMTTTIAVTGGIGGYAGVTLLTLPSLPNCPNIFWPTASAALRMQCADLAASKNTTKDLLKAIALVDALPESHPMRSQIDGFIEEWALDILDLAEVSFHNGDLDGAISSAKRIPIHLKAYEQVDSHIEKWQSIWDNGEQIYQDAEEFLVDEDLRGAFAIAVRLLSVKNEYWKTEKYNELTDLIETSRVDTAKLNEARQLAKGGDVSALLDAMNLVKEIQPESRLYVPARRTLSGFLEDLVELGIKALDRGDAKTTMQVARNLPTGVEFQAQAQDFRELSFALSQAEGGTVNDLETAIAQAQALGSNRPLYDKAQRMIGHWEIEIQDTRYLTRARELAQLGQIPDLQAAIAEAQLIRYDNPRGDEAQVAIGEWTREVQTLQDRPQLREAREIAERGGIRSLEAAIQRLEGINEGRPLYYESRQLINEWNDEIEMIQDQPYLSDATQFAARGNLPAAIAAAQQIRSGRVLHNEAQSNIRRWQDQINGEIFLREAYDAAQRGNPSAWARAIRTADRISAGHTNRSEANRLINRWGQNILSQAQQTAQISYEEAITIANLIPSQAGAYTEAQLQIETWQRAIAERDYWQNPIQPIVPVEHSGGGWQDENTFINTIDDANINSNDPDGSGLDSNGLDSNGLDSNGLDSNGLDSNGTENSSTTTDRPLDSDTNVNDDNPDAIAPSLERSDTLPNRVD